MSRQFQIKKLIKHQRFDTLKINPSSLIPFGRKSLRIVHERRNTKVKTSIVNELPGPRYYECSSVKEFAVFLASKLKTAKVVVFLTARQINPLINCSHAVSIRETQVQFIRPWNIILLRSVCTCQSLARKFADFSNRNFYFYRPFQSEFARTSERGSEVKNISLI